MHTLTLETSHPKQSVFAFTPSYHHDGCPIPHERHEASKIPTPLLSRRTQYRDTAFPTREPALSTWQLKQLSDTACTSKQAHRHAVFLRACFTSTPPQVISAPLSTSSPPSPSSPKAPTRSSTNPPQRSQNRSHTHPTILHHRSSPPPRASHCTQRRRGKRQRTCPPCRGRCGWR